MFDLIFRRLRLSEPWRFKAPVLICIPYFFFIAGEVPFSTALIALCSSFCTIIGIAGFGYFCNDVADRKTDHQAGLDNGTLDLTVVQIALLFIFFLTAALLPWVVYFPVDWASLGLLAAEFMLFILYSVPPFRLKERGMSGLMADALYAHVNPALLAAYTFHLLTNRVYGHLAWFMVTLGGWQFFLGLRNILLHQITDLDNDRAAGTVTFAVRIGARSAHRILAYLLVPLEISGFILFTAVVSLTVPAMAIAWPLFLLVVGLIIRLHWRQELMKPLIGRIDHFLDEYYLRWMPVILLGALCLRDLRMIVLLLLHLSLFKNGVTPLFKKTFASLS